MAFSDMERLAEHVAKSNLFGMKTKEQALVLMMVSHAEGRHPVLAARDYDVIQGRPAKKSEAMLRDFLQAGGRVEWHALSDDIADATFTHPQGGSARISWNMDRANKAGMAGKDNWKKFPRQMLRSRTVSEGVRTVFPLATSGLYVPEEVADFAGQTIEAELSERDAINAEIPLRAAAAPAPRPARKTEQETPKSRTDEQWRVWLDKLRAACDVLYRRDEVVEVANRPSVGDAISTGPEWVQREIAAILADNYARFPSEDEPGDLPEVEIAGEEKMASG
jgi:hypothetical protein